MTRRSIDLAEYCRPVAFVVEYERHCLGYDEGSCRVVWDTSAMEALEWAQEQGDAVGVKREPMFDQGESARIWLEAGYSYECEACSHRVTAFGDGAWCDTTETGDGVIVGERVYCSRQCAEGCPEEHQEEEE